MSDRGTGLGFVQVSVYIKKIIGATTALRRSSTKLEWVKVFGGDEKLTTALLDRLAHHATVIATKGKSYRMRKKGVTDVKDEEADPAALPRAGRKA